jgi:hypothetical protein
MNSVLEYFKINRPGMSLAALELVLVLVIGFRVRLGSEFVRVRCSWSDGSDTDRAGLFIADFNCGLYRLASCLGLGMGVFPGPLDCLCARSSLGRGIEFCAALGTWGQSAYIFVGSRLPPFG